MSTSEFDQYIQHYFSLIPSEDWISEMKNVSTATVEMYNKITEEQGNFAYAEGKWSLKVVLEHVTDTEKVFQYRALRFSRKDNTALHGFDENSFAENGSSHLTKADLLEDFQLTRLNSLAFFSKLSTEQYSRKGIANAHEFSVESLGKLIVAHNIHHLNIIKERYLPLLTHGKSN